MLFSILHRLSGESRNVPDIGLTTIRLSQIFRIDPSTLVVTQLDAQNSRQETLFPDDSGNYLPVVGGQKLEVEGTSIDQAQGTQNGRPMRNGGPPSPPFTLFRSNQQTRNPFGVSNVRNRNTSRMDAENVNRTLNCLLPEPKYIEVTAENDISVDKVNKVLSESSGKPTVICDIHGQAIPDTAETQGEKADSNGTTGTELSLLSSSPANAAAPIDVDNGPPSPKRGTIDQGPALTHTEVLRRKRVADVLKHQQEESDDFLRHPITQHIRSSPSTSPQRHRRDNGMPSPTTDHVPLAVRKTKAQRLREETSHVGHDHSFSPPTKRTALPAAARSPRLPLTQTTLGVANGFSPNRERKPLNKFSPRGGAGAHSLSPKRTTQPPVNGGGLRAPFVSPKRSFDTGRRTNVSPRLTPHVSPHRNAPPAIPPKPVKKTSPAVSPRSPAKKLKGDGKTIRPKKTVSPQKAEPAKPSTDPAAQSEVDPSKLTADGEEEEDAVPTLSTNLEEQLLGDGSPREDSATAVPNVEEYQVANSLRQIVEEHERNVDDSKTPTNDELSSSVNAAVAEIESVTKDIPTAPKSKPTGGGGGMLAKALEEARSSDGAPSSDSPTTKSTDAQSAEGQRRPYFVPKQSSRDTSSGSSDERKHSKTRQPVGTIAKALNRVTNETHGATVAAEHAAAHPEEDKKAFDEKFQSIYADSDPSTKLLLLCKKGEWILTDNILRYTPANKLDLSMADENGFTPLLLAVKDGRLQMIERLVELGANLKAVTKDGRNAAHIAAMYAKEDTMRYLISKGINLKTPAGQSARLPLHMACNRSSSSVLPMVQLLLQHTPPGDIGSPRLIQDGTGRIGLHLAVDNGNAAIVRELLKDQGGKQIKVQRVDNGDTAMHTACEQRHMEIVKMLVQHGADANIQNRDGRTPLHVVAQLGDDSLLRVMYGLKADANICDKNHKTPLHVAAENGHTNVVEILIDKFKASITARTKDGDTLMHIAANNGHAQTATAFLKRGVPLHMPNRKGALGIHNAAAMGHIEVVKTLITKGTPVDIKTKDNFTALHIAVKHGQIGMVETLLGLGASCHIQGGQLGITPLHIAADLDGQDANGCAEMLLKSGAEANIRQSNGETALHIAARKGRPQMIQLLLEENANAMGQSDLGETPLHLSAKFCHCAAAKMLIRFTEQTSSKNHVRNYINLKNSHGLTALHMAAEITPDKLHYPQEDAELMELLIDAGGDVILESQSTGETVMHHCARSGNEDVLMAIVEKIGPGAVQIAMNKQSKGGWSPLLEACDRGHVGVVKILLDHHARVDVFDADGKTGLHLAAANGHHELSDLLLKHKAFVNSKTKSGEAPLHLTAMNGHNRLVTLLVQHHGASLDSITLFNQTPLHSAAKSGQLAVSSALLAMGANPNAKDNKGQTPLHLAAENDYPEVVKLFLKMKQNNRSVLTAVDENGFTCAHIAAMKGSMAVVKELMQIDKAMVIEAKTKTTESTALHMAAAGGHKNIVNILLENGASDEDENSHGMTPLHLIGKNGHIRIIDLFERALWRRCSRKTGLNPLHIAAYFGQTEFASEILQIIPATVRSEPPLYNHLVVKELATEYGLTPLHMAAQSGHDGLVRMLLNIVGVQVDASTTTMGVIPLHLAAQSGHIAVVGMLLSRSTSQLQLKDSRGRTALHLASMNGHYDMVSLLIAQGSNINVMDQNGWTSMHFATKAGHLQVLKLLMQSSADPQAETKEGKIALCFAAAHCHNGALSYLMKQEHDTHSLMEDRKFIFDLMICGKGHQNKPVEEFILRSPVPIDTAVRLSSLYWNMAEKEKERGRDLLNMSTICQNMAVELLSIAATEYNPAMLLKAHDRMGKPFLDILIEHDQKEVVSHASVQRYMTDVLNGGVEWGFGKLTAFFLVVLTCPPAWIFFSLPLNFKLCKAPIIKFICHVTSHVYFTILLTLVVLNILQKIYEVKSFIPHPVEWLLLLWLSGNLVAELNNYGGRDGIGIIRMVILFLAAIAIAIHVVAFIYPEFVPDTTADERKRLTLSLLYLKNQLFAFCLLFCFIQYLEFLQVHHLFGPWAIIIRDLMRDLTRFLVIMMLFLAGFTLHVTSIFQPAFEEATEEDASMMRLASVYNTIEMLFFSLFGLVEPDNMPPLHLVPDFSKLILKVVFGIYMMVTLIVLINLLIAMMSDTYQRIQAQSDTEWKFGRAKLIRQMNKKSATPSPINMLTKFITYIRVAWRNKLNMCTMKAQEDLRAEENIDSFSMSGTTGRTSPAAKMLASADDDGEAMGNVEIGKSDDWKMETIINWPRIVGLFYTYQGTTDEDEETTPLIRAPDVGDATDNVSVHGVHLVDSTLGGNHDYK